MNYRNIDDRIRKIESQLEPILSTPLNPDTTPSEHHAVERLNQYLHYIHNLILAEKASSTEHPVLSNFARRVILLQRATHAWTDGWPLTPSIDSGVSTPSSNIESCLTDDDSEIYYKGEVSSGSEFKVYDNPEFVTFPDHDNHYVNGDGDDEGSIDEDEDEAEVAEVAEVQEDEEKDISVAADQDEVHKSEAVKEEDEISTMDNEEEDGEEAEEGSRNWCYKFIFWGSIIGMGVVSIMVGFPDFPDHHTTVMILTPT